MKKNIIIVLASLFSLISCSNVDKYKDVVVDKYSKGITYISHDVRYKQMSNYRLKNLKELSVTEDSVILEHEYKCDLLYFIGSKRFRNVAEIDTICLYKNENGKYEFRK